MNDSRGVERLVPLVLATEWGLAAGTLVLGLGGRLLMSGIALVLVGAVEWDPAGTLQVVALGAAIGPPAGLLYWAVRERLPGPPPVRGLVFGAINGAFWVGVYYLRPAGPIELMTAPWSVWLFGLLLLAFGVMVAVMVERGVSRPVTPRFVMARLGLAGMLVVGGAALAMFALASR